jgi:hypothetical protein
MNTGKEEKVKVVRYIRVMDIRGIYRELGCNARAN